MAQAYEESDKEEIAETVSELKTLKALFDASEMDFWECKASDNSNKDAIIFDGCSMWNPKSYLVCQGCHKKLRSEASSLPVQWRWSATDASLINSNDKNSKTSNYDDIESLYHQWILYDIESMIKLESNYQKGISNFDLTILVISDDYGMNNQRFHYKIDLNKWTQSRRNGGGRPRTIQRIDCNDYEKHNTSDKQNNNNNNNSNKEDICPICQCGFEWDSNDVNDDMITLCNSHHYMHRSCAKLLINSNNGVKCPQCRQPMLLPVNVTIDEKKKQYEAKKLGSLEIGSNDNNNNNNGNNVSNVSKEKSTNDEKSDGSVENKNENSGSNESKTGNDDQSGSNDSIDSNNNNNNNNGQETNNGKKPRKKFPRWSKSGKSGSKTNNNKKQNSNLKPKKKPKRKRKWPFDKSSNKSDADSNNMNISNNNNNETESDDISIEKK